MYIRNKISVLKTLQSYNVFNYCFSDSYKPPQQKRLQSFTGEDTTYHRQYAAGILTINLEVDKKLNRGT